MSCAHSQLAVRLRFICLTQLSSSLISLITHLYPATEKFHCVLGSGLHPKKLPLFIMHLFNRTEKMRFHNFICRIWSYFLISCFVQSNVFVVLFCPILFTPHFTLYQSHLTDRKLRGNRQITNLERNGNKLGLTCAELRSSLDRQLDWDWVGRSKLKLFQQS